MTQYGADAMSKARAEREARIDAAGPWMRPALDVYLHARMAANARGSERALAVHPRMTQAERDAMPPFISEDEQIVTELRAHFTRDAPETTSAPRATAPVFLDVTVVRSKFFEKPVEYVVPAAPGEGEYLLRVEANEAFRVSGDNDMSEGRGGTYVVGYYTSLPMALDAARGRGAQGSLGYIYLVRPVLTPVNAINEAGESVEIAQTTTMHAVHWESRLTERGKTN